MIVYFDEFAYMMDCLGWTALDDSEEAGIVGRFHTEEQARAWAEKMSKDN
jgi:hypothetical protein